MRNILNIGKDIVNEIRETGNSAYCSIYSILEL